MQLLLTYLIHKYMYYIDYLCVTLRCPLRYFVVKIFKHKGAQMITQRLIKFMN